MTTWSSKESFSDAGGAINEDRIGVSGPFFWMIDGATGLNGRRLLPGDTDAAWFADAWNKALHEVAPRHSRVADAIREACGVVDARLEAVGAADMARADYPALALILGHLVEDSLEVANIGDCTMIVSSGRRLRTVGTSEVEGYDALALARFTSALDDHASYAEAQRVARAQILLNRRSANEPSGYWVIDPSDRWVEHVQLFEMAVDREPILVATDGYMRAMTIYGICPDLERVMQMSTADGLERVVARIRKIEAEDQECRRHPRLKRADDASAMVLTYGRQLCGPRLP